MLQRNPSELLRLLHAHGLLEDAANLAVEYISAVLGDGKEYFGLSSSLNAHSSPVWLPVNAIEQLLMELRLNADVDVVYSKVQYLAQTFFVLCRISRIISLSSFWIS